MKNWRRNNTSLCLFSESTTLIFQCTMKWLGIKWLAFWHVNWKKLLLSQKRFFIQCVVLRTFMDVLYNHNEILLLNRFLILPTGEGASIKLIYPNQLLMYALIRGHKKYISCLCFHPKQTRLLFSKFRISDCPYVNLFFLFHACFALLNKNIIIVAHVLVTSLT